jgi:site-specific DNA-methyltransferase (adenine-specific)/modification methylase
MSEPVRIGEATLYCGDCLDILTTLGPVDAVVTDPPYGVNWKSPAPRRQGPGVATKSHDRLYGQDFPVIYGDDSNFDPSPFLLGDKQIVWGAHVFYDRLPANGGMLVWDKSCGDFDNISFGQCELAWRSWSGAVRIFRHKWMGLVRKGIEREGSYNQARLHPNEKPISLFNWCLGFLPDSHTILDPFMGSGTTGVACARLGRKFIGIEIEPRYFDIACERIRREYAQLKLFPQEEKRETVQLELEDA